MKLNKLSIVALLVGATVLLLSCNENNETETYDSREILERPNVSADSIVVLRSDSAQTILRFSAPRLINDVDENNLEYSECPDGFLLERFNNEGEITTRISAEYGKQFTKEERFEALGNVVVTTEKGDTLKTEQLIFLKKKDRLYSEKYTRIFQKDRIMHGMGFESDSKMRNRTFFKTYGTIWVDNTSSPKQEARKDSLVNDTITRKKTE